MAIKMKLALMLCVCLQTAAAFIPQYRAEEKVAFSDATSFQTVMAAKDDHVTQMVGERRGFLASSVAGIITGIGAFVSRGMAATDEYEIAELPPPYVPALFAVALLAGVGLLTGSLGDVMDEGELLRNFWMWLFRMMSLTRS